MRTLPRRLHPQRLRRTLGAASCVRERARFVLSELRDTPAVGSYHLRESGLVAQIRHPLLDMWVLEEVFRFRAYEPPDPVARLLGEATRALRIVDLGGHVGLFGLFVRGLYPDTAVVSFEPDPGNANLLRRCIEANRLQERWSLVEACAATSDGAVDFASSYHLSRIAQQADSPLQEMHRRVGRTFGFLEDTPLVRAERRRVASRDVFPFLTDADLVKIDIEGGEWELLADTRLHDIEAVALVIEYHPAYGGPGDDAEQAVRRQLERAGYESFAGRRGAEAGVLWAWRDGSRSG